VAPRSGGFGAAGLNDTSIRSAWSTWEFEASEAAAYPVLRCWKVGALSGSGSLARVAYAQPGVILSEAKNRFVTILATALQSHAKACPVYTYHVYIMASASRVLYIGVTGDLLRRSWNTKRSVSQVLPPATA
jgi:hypothetical protein